MEIIPRRSTALRDAFTCKRDERMQSAFDLVVALGLVEVSIWELCGSFTKAYDAIALPAVAILMIRSWRRHRTLNSLASGDPIGKAARDFSRCRTWLLCGAATAVMVVGLVYLGRLVRVEGEQFRRYWLAKDWEWCATKILVVAIQQLVLYRFLLPNFRDLFRSDAAGCYGVATVFGLIHLPSLMLTGLTTLSGLVWCWIYSRSGRIAPLFLSHLILAILAYGTLPARLNYNMGIGANGLEARRLYKRMESGKLSDLHRTFSSNEYYAASGRTNRAMISACVQDVYGYVPSENEIAWRLGWLHGYSPTDVATHVIGSPRFERHLDQNGDEWIPALVEIAERRIAAAR